MPCYYRMTLNSVEHCICTTSMTHIRPRLESNLIPLSFEPIWTQSQIWFIVDLSIAGYILYIWPLWYNYHTITMITFRAIFWFHWSILVIIFFREFACTEYRKRQAYQTMYGRFCNQWSCVIYCGSAMTNSSSCLLKSISSYCCLPSRRGVPVCRQGPDGWRSENWIRRSCKSGDPFLR